MARSSLPAFTLYETVVTLAITGIVVAAAWRGLSALLGIYEAESAAYRDTAARLSINTAIAAGMTATDSFSVSGDGHVCRISDIAYVTDSASVYAVRAPGDTLSRAPCNGCVFRRTGPRDLELVTPFDAPGVHAFRIPFPVTAPTP